MTSQQPVPVKHTIATDKFSGDITRTYGIQDVDWFLQNLVALANDMEGFEFPLTLHVDGAAVSGLVISGKAYFSEFADQFVGGATSELASWMRETIAGYSSIYDLPKPPDAVPPLYIHMREARTISAHGVFPQNGVLWRGRVSAVSGFSLGRMALEETPSDD